MVFLATVTIDKTKFLCYNTNVLTFNINAQNRKDGAPMNGNTCFTQFAINGIFDPDEITKRLGLQPDDTVKMGEHLRANRTADIARWEFGKCSEYDVYTEKQMLKTITPLMDKIDELKSIARDYKVDMYLNVVPSLTTGRISPALAPSLEVMNFCVATGTKIDIDLYLLERDSSDDKGDYDD